MPATRHMHGWPAAPEGLAGRQAGWLCIQPAEQDAAGVQRAALGGCPATPRPAPCQCTTRICAAFIADWSCQCRMVPASAAPTAASGMLQLLTSSRVVASFLPPVCELTQSVMRPGVGLQNSISQPTGLKPLALPPPSPLPGHCLAPKLSPLTGLTHGREHNPIAGREHHQQLDFVTCPSCCASRLLARACMVQQRAGVGGGCQAAMLVPCLRRGVVGRRRGWATGVLCCTAACCPPPASLAMLWVSCAQQLAGLARIV